VAKLGKIAQAATRAGVKTYLTADGFEEAFLRFARNDEGRLVTCYSRRRCVRILMQWMPKADAEEYFDFNVAGAYAGPMTPLFR